MKRVIAYIDGFNLYYGLEEKRWKRFYWLNIQRLIQYLLKPDQKLETTKYFTAQVISTPHDPDKARRQVFFLEALQTLPDFEIFYGHYLLKNQTCYACGSNWIVHEEKMTDVNIAVEMLTDAFHDRFDMALLVSGDSDLCGPLEKIRQHFPDKRVIIAFPPARESVHLKRFADGSFIIGRRNIARSQFPDEVQKPDGIILRRPSTWK